MSEELQKQIIDEFRDQLSELRKAHESFEHWNNCRRGVEGPRGLPGEPSNIPGPQGAPGRDGKDADVAQVIAAAKQQMQSDLAVFQAGLGAAIVAELKRSGVVDEGGKAILIPGPAGRDGKDSVVPGPRGVRGETGSAGKDSIIPGPAGRDGVDGQSIVGPSGRDGVDGRDGVITPADIAHMEAKFRNLWKNDIQAALRAHFNESHQS